MKEINKDGEASWRLSLHPRHEGGKGENDATVAP